MLSLSAANIFYMVINLLVLYLIFHIFLFKRVDRVLDARREEVENCTKDSLAAKKEAEEMKAKYEGDRKALDAQKSQVIQDARDKGYHEYENIIANANKKASEILEDARRDAKLENQKQRAQFEAEITDMVLSAASKISATAHTVQTDRELYDRFIEEASNKNE